MCVDRCVHLDLDFFSFLLLLFLPSCFLSFFPSCFLLFFVKSFLSSWSEILKITIIGGIICATDCKTKLWFHSQWPLFLSTFHRSLIFFSAILLTHLYFCIISFSPPEIKTITFSLRRRKTHPLAYSALHPERGPQPFKSAHVIIKPTSDRRISFHSRERQLVSQHKSVRRAWIECSPTKVIISGLVLYSRTHKDSS